MKTKPSSKTSFILLLLSLFLINSLSAQKTISTYEITGKVLDIKTKEYLIGVKVFCKNTKFKTATNLEGIYKLKGVSVGKNVLVFQYIGYNNFEKEIELVEGKSVVVVDVLLKPSDNVLNEIKISDTLQNTESEKYSIKIESNAPSVINSISAKAIQISPDLTVANVLQRVSAVSLERSNTGDGQYAIIRGMDKRYNYTMINGVKIPSPDNKNRYVPMDLFPSDLIERLEVIKALTPSMEADAIGGAMNMVMKNAPEKFVVTANVGSGYSGIFSNRPYSGFSNSVLTQQNFLKDPSQINGASYQAKVGDFNRNVLNYSNSTPPLNSIFGFSIGNRFLKNKLGVIVAASYQNTYRGANTNVLLPSSQPYNAPNRDAPMPLHFEDINYREYSINQTRQGYHGKIDYKFNKRHTISFYTVYMMLDEIQVRHTVDTNTKAQRSGPGTGEVHEYDRTKVTNQTIYNGTLQGTHDLIYNIKINWSAVYSIATSITPSWVDFERVHGVSLDSSKNQIVLPTQVGKINTRWLNNTDEDKTGYLNIIYSPKIMKRDVEFSAGGMYRMKHRTNYYNVYELTPTADKNGNYPQYFTNVNDALFALLGTNAGLGTPKDANNYKIDENILAYYGQVKFNPIKKLQVLGGVRLENTLQSYVSAADPKYVVGASGSKEYMDILPSVHFKYSINKKSNIRLSYFASLARPSFYEIIPYTLPGENFTEEGNYKLQHTTADNYDLRYEFFPKGLNQLLVGVFYKNIYNPIEYGFYREPGNPTGVYIAPQNFGDATNYGFEMQVTKYIGNFGINANYTFTASNITTSKLIYYRNSSGNLTTDSITQTRPLQGQSAHIGNLSFLYKNGKLGINAQLAAVYTGRRIAQLSPYYNLDIWQRGVVQIDFSVEKRFFKRLYVYLKINNILNTPYVTEIVQANTYRSGTQQLPIQDNNESVTTQREIYFQSYTVGLRYRFE